MSLVAPFCTRPSSKSFAVKLLNFYSALGGLSVPTPGRGGVHFPVDAQLREGCSGQSPSGLGHGAAPAGQRTRHGRTESQNISPLKSIPRQISPSPTPTAGQDFSKDEVPSEAQKVWVSPPLICLVCFSSRIFYITKRNPEAPVGEKEKLRAALVRTASGPFSVLFLLPSPRGISAFTLKKHDLWSPSPFSR